MLSESIAQVLLVIGGIEDDLEFLKLLLALVGNMLPCLLEPADGGVVKSGLDSEEAVVVVELLAFHRYLDPVLDDESTLPWEIGRASCRERVF